MIAAQPIIDQLGAAGFQSVEGVIEWAGLKGAPAHSPALFVIPARETAGANQLVGVHDQRVIAQFRVVIVLKPSARVKGKPNAQLEDEEARVIDAIAGWKHPQTTGGAEYAGGQLLSADGWGVAWAVDFRTAWRLRKGNS